MVREAQTAVFPPTLSTPNCTFLENTKKEDRGSSSPFPRAGWRAQASSCTPCAQLPGGPRALCPSHERLQEEEELISRRSRRGTAAGTLASAVLQGTCHQWHQITFPRRCDPLQHLTPYPATSDLDCHKETLRKDSATLRPALEGSDAELGVENHRAGEICCL